MMMMKMIFGSRTEHLPPVPGVQHAASPAGEPGCAVCDLSGTEQLYQLAHSSSR